MKPKIFIIILCLTFSSLFSFPISVYDFRLPTTSISPMEAALGGLNVATGDDFFLMYTNPSLLANVRRTTFSASFKLSSDSYENFSSVLKTQPFLKNNNFRGFTFQAKQIAFGYQVLTEDRFKIETENSKLYQDYKLNSYALAFSDTVGTYNWGLNLKLLDGRLVYLSQDRLISGVDTLLIASQFIDSKALGYSFDLGLSTSKRGLSYGFVVYDVYSAIRWKSHDKHKIRTRGAFTIDLSSQNYSIGAGVNNRWHSKSEPFYNQYYVYRFSIGRPDVLQQGSLRFGMCSKDYKNQDSILFSFGLGYFYRIVRIDIAMQSQGWKSSQTQYLFSLSVGD